MARILVVEDDPTMGALLDRGLSEEGHDVTLVGNGVDALIAFSSGPLDVAVVDVMLPKMSGFEVCRRIRESGSQLPVIVITARDSVDDRIFGLDAGADDYVTKPFHFGELSARIRHSSAVNRALRNRCSKSAPSGSIRSPPARACTDGRSP